MTNVVRRYLDLIEEVKNSKSMTEGQKKISIANLKSNLYKYEKRSLWIRRIK